jgi:hypothetical protein
VEACFVTELRFNRDSGPWRTVDIVRHIQAVPPCSSSYSAVFEGAEDRKMPILNDEVIPSPEDASSGPRRHALRTVGRPGAPQVLAGDPLVQPQ